MMTSLFKKIVLWKLRFLACAYVKVKKIEIIAITGSAGKTTAKHAIKTIFKRDLELFVPEENYNTESGVPSAIFQLKNPESLTDILAWCTLILKMISKFFQKAPYKSIVLEYSADKPGDIDYLVKIAKPHIAIVISVIPAHYGGFGSLEAIAEEKGTTVRVLGAEDFAILNFDNKFVKDMAKQTKGRILSTGMSQGSDLRYKNLKYNESGMALDLFWKDQSATLELPVLAPHLIPSFLAAIGLALLKGKGLSDATSKLINFIPEKGRMNVLKGVNDSIIIDDSYNSNPESAKAALKVLSYYGGRKIAVLGSMNELGDFTKAGHEQVGAAATKVSDEVLVVGEVAGQYLYPVVLKKMNKKFVHKFNSAEEAGEYLKLNIKKGDVILFKGSQNGVFVEEAVKYVLANTNKAGELLVRQGPMWQRKKGNS